MVVYWTTGVRKLVKGTARAQPVWMRLRMIHNWSEVVQSAPSINPDSLETTPGAPCSWR